MGDVMRELERLRPVYETGVLRLLLRQNSMLYVALLRASFDPLTGELPRETLEDEFAQSLSRLVETGEYVPHDDQTLEDAAHQILLDLTREGDGDYAWLANSLDVVSHRFLYRLTSRAHRAIEALSRLEDDSQVLSGAQANSIIMEIEHARMQLTADPHERIELLRHEIDVREQEIDRLEHDPAIAELNARQVEDIIAVVHNTLRGVPVDLRDLALSERDNGDNLRRRMQSGAIAVDDILTAYHDEFRRDFHESDSGRRFEDAFQVIVTEEGRRQIDEAVRAIARTPYLTGEPEILLNQVKSELERIYEGIEDVRRQMRASDEAVSRLVRQQTDTRYRMMLSTLNRLFVSINADLKTRGVTTGGDAPYRTDTATVRLGVLPTRPAKEMTRSITPGLNHNDDGSGITADDFRSMVEVGGPRLRRMISLIRQRPVLHDGLIDIAGSFNRLPDAERRESELIGFLGALRVRDGDDYVDWRCVTLDGQTRTWRTRPLLVSQRTLAEIARDDC